MALLPLIPKRAQVWGMDLVVAVAIFSVSLTIFYFYALNGTSEGIETIELLSYEGRQISSSLLSEGYPEQWNQGNVIEIGLTTSGKLNETKLEAFYEMTQSDYNQTKSLLKTTYDFYFFLERNLTLGNVTVRGIGKSGFDPLNYEVSDLVSIRRIVIYQNRPTEAYLYIWKG